MLRYVAAVFTILALPISASAQTPAESNPEAVYISKTYGIPQLNGRLLLPGDYKNRELAELIKPVALGWKNYFRTYRLDTTSPGTMVFYAAKTPGRLAQILRTHTTLSEETIREAEEDPGDFSYTLESAGREYLTQFEVRAVMAALVEIYKKEIREPQRNLVPVTILLEGRLQGYNFETQQASLFLRSLSTAAQMPKDWQKQTLDGKRIPLANSINLDIPEERANAIYAAGKSNPLGRNVIYVGVETSAPLLSGARFPGIDRIVYSFSWNLSNPFFVYDVAAKKKAIDDAEAERLKNAWDQQVEERNAVEEDRNAAQEEERTAAQELESEGFSREEDAARFESAGLIIGAPPPDTLAFTRYETSGFKSTQFAQNGSNFPAASAFFHTIIEGGQVAFLTSDGQAQSPVVYYARYFSDNNLSAEVLRNAAIKKLGQPQYSGANVAYWWDVRLPEDISVGCRPKIAEVVLGNTTFRNNQWSRHPLSIDFNEFSEDCGIIGAMKFNSKKYAVADTTFFNRILSESLVAEQQLAKDLAAKVAAKAADEKEKAKILEAKAEKEFEF